MAPCSGKPKCGCGCPKKRKASKRKAPGSSKAGKKPLPSSYAGQRGSAVIQSFPGPIQPQFTPSFQTPIPSAVTKMTVEDIRKKEISTQTEDIKPESLQSKPIAVSAEKKTRKPRTKVVLKPVEPQAKLEPIAKRELSKSAIAAINRSQSARPIERVGNVVAFAPEPVQEPKPAKVEDIKPRPRGRPPGAKALGKNALPGVQQTVTSLSINA
jgi:hypothetical protein